MTAEAPGTMDRLTLGSGDLLYLGGHPDGMPYPGVQAANFSGCVEEVFVGQDRANLRDYAQAQNAREGCQIEVRKNLYLE